MKHNTVMIVLMLIAMIASTSNATPPDAEQSVADWIKQAEMQLAAGEYDKALKSYAGAIEVDPKNEDLKQQYIVLRQVIRVREMHANEQDTERRGKMATALRSFYYDNGLFKEALKLDKVTHADVPNADSTANVAESHLELNENAEVVKFLSVLPEKKQTPRTRTLLAIALLRESNTKDAKALAAKVQMPEEDDAGLYFELACMYSLLDDADLSSKMLTHSFQMTRPSLMEKAHARAMARADLKPLVDSGAMKVAMATKSKVAESSCSGQSSCAGCPSASESGDEASGCDSKDK